MKNRPQSSRFGETAKGYTILDHGSHRNSTFDQMSRLPFSVALTRSTVDGPTLSGAPIGSRCPPRFSRMLRISCVLTMDSSAAVVHGENAIRCVVAKADKRQLDFGVLKYG